MKKHSLLETITGCLVVGFLAVYWWVSDHTELAFVLWLLFMLWIITSS